MKVFLAVALLVGVGAAYGDARDYEVHDKVSVEVDTVGPYHNPAERFMYYSMPVCQPSKLDTRRASFSDNLSGTVLRNAVFDIRFQDSISYQAVCSLKLKPSDIDRYVQAIDDSFIFQIFVDDLPVIGFFGEKVESFRDLGDHSHTDFNYYLYTHFIFDISYNDGHVITCNITADPTRRVLLKHDENDLEVEFSFQTIWKPTDVTVDHRLLEHSKHLWGDQTMEIHWLSIINSLVLVLLLTAFLATILMGILRNDFARYMEADVDELGGDIDDSGWKQVHGDVFRFPEHPMMLSAMIGTGAQILVLFIIMLVLSLVGTFYEGNRGSLYSVGLFLYALTAGISGFVSATLYKQLGGEKWATNAVLTASMFTVPFIVIFAVLNSLAVAHGSTVSVPFATIALIVLLWALVTFPLTVLGASRGRKSASRFQAPCKTNRVRREIPATPWYHSRWSHMFVAGFLSFSGQYIELHYLFSSIWGHQAYRMYGMLFAAFLVTVVISSFITIALTYFQLASEDYRWWWRSFFNGGSTGLFVYAYSVFFYCYRSNMSGNIQFWYFFGYMAVTSYAIFLMLGAVGFASSLLLVRHVYSSIKAE